MFRVRTPSGLQLLAVVALALPGAAHATGAFDGTYTGPQTISRTNNTSACSNLDHPVTVRIVDDSFSRKWGGGKYGGDELRVHVGPDGGFSTTITSSNAGRGPMYAQSYSLQGHISGGVLEGELGSNLCAVKWVLHKS